ncbi:hypothetical protein MY1884_003963 [Beauveria asiatica]
MSSPPNPLSTASLYRASHTVMSGVFPCARARFIASASPAVMVMRNRFVANLVRRPLPIAEPQYTAAFVICASSRATRRASSPSPASTEYYF